jgi:hypothetical protein
MDQQELEADLRQASILIEDESSRSRTLQSCPDPASSSSSKVSDEDIKVLKAKHAFLADFSDTFIRNTPIGDLMKIESTALKAREIERSKDSEDKLPSTSRPWPHLSLKSGQEGTTGGPACILQDSWGVHHAPQ